ncbi:hypothetical protein L914_12855 [Phytophthora nicotianae]|uniref:START domain-containing protein n=2 Tax=Phytophthora nicotianae TaxID=4792 RepID=V9ERD5_PHYNI|nr:hypothetical protein F443_13361 [Phytophthora nicotianae P1569]ETM41363.1 hypothetical protein L914_12855 [Phytophthora nicotianae]
MYRRRAKNERDSLRKEVIQLTDHLTRLSQAKKNNNADSGVVATSPWEILTLCNRQRRLEAEKDKKRLLAAVSSQKMLIEELISVIRKFMRSVPAVYHVSLQDVRVLEQQKDMELYNMLMREMDSNFSSIGSVLAAQGVELMSEGVVKSIVKFTDGRVKNFQYRRKTVFPFQFDQVCRSLWERTHLYHQLCDRQVSEVFNSENSYAVKLRSTRKHPASCSASILHRLVLRRYVLEGDVVIVWRAFVEGEFALKGMNSSESGWIRLRPSNTGIVMEMYVNQMPVCLSSFQSCDSRVAEFLEMVLDFGQDNEEQVFGGMASLSTVDDRNFLGLNKATERLSLHQLKVES